ncbi:hypothetical protein [Georgenia sp. SUBG003]|uniref:hypothetical protein n=1 Tax=Georgenia sp. SUBG003 TaxID=1497974 RepID=UPI003AB22B37
MEQHERRPLAGALVGDREPLDVHPAHRPPLHVRVLTLARAPAAGGRNRGSGRARAPAAGEQVEIVVVGPRGTPERRRVRPLSVDGGRVRVADVARETELTLAIHRISAVAAVSAG